MAQPVGFSGAIANLQIFQTSTARDQGTYHMRSKPIAAEFSKKKPIKFIKPFAIAGMLIIFRMPLHAMDIYRWVDDAGQTHMSDVVPEKYKAVAKRIDSKKFDISDADRLQAQDRAAKDKLLTERKPSDVVAEPTVLNDPKLANPKLAPPMPQGTCSQKWDAYYSSQECFAPFTVRSRYGNIIRPEGFQQCQIVESPVKTCDYDKRLSR